MDLSEWGVPIATVGPVTGWRGTMARWGGIAMVAVAIGTAGWVLSLGGDPFQDGYFLVPCFFGLTGAGWLVIDRAGRRHAEAIGPGWYVQRTGSYGPPRGFRMRDVERVRTSAGVYLHGRYAVLLIVETSTGQQFKVPTAVDPASAALRSELARQLGVATTDVDPAAATVLETLAGADRHPQAADAGLSSVDRELRLDEDGRLRWPRGTFQLALTGVMLIAMGVLGVVLDLLPGSASADPTDLSSWLWVALFLGGGALSLWLLWRLRRRDLATWRAQRDASTASGTGTGH